MDKSKNFFAYYIETNDGHAGEIDRLILCINTYTLIVDY